MIICPQDVLKTSLQDVLKTSSKRLKYILKISWRCFCRTSWRFFKKTNHQDKYIHDSFRCFCETSWKRLEDRSLRWMYSCSLVHLEDVFWRHMTKANILVLIKRSRIQRWKMSLWCLQNFFITTNVCQVINDVLLNKNDSISTNVSSNQSFFGSLTLWLSVQHFYFLPCTFCFKLMSHIAIY